MNTGYHRVLVWFTGMPDEGQTSACSGECNQGRACTCDTELACDMGPSPDRVIQPPIQTPEDRRAIALARRGAVLTAVGLWAGLAGLLKLFGARSLG